MGWFDPWVGLDRVTQNGPTDNSDTHRRTRQNSFVGSGGVKWALVITPARNRVLSAKEAARIITDSEASREMKRGRETAVDVPSSTSLGQRVAD